MRDAEVNARGPILFKSTQLLAYADDIDIMGRTAQDVQTEFIQIEQAAIGARSWAAHKWRQDKRYGGNVSTKNLPTNNTELHW